MMKEHKQSVLKLKKELEKEDEYFQRMMLEREQSFESIKVIVTLKSFHNIQ